MNKILVLTVAVFLSGICAGSSFGEELAQRDKALKTIFPDVESCEFRKIVLTPDQMKTLEQKGDILFNGTHSPEIIFCAAQKKAQTIGYAFEDTVVGKWGPIHYLLGISAEGKVLGTVILDYQEIRGKPIAKKRFLSQYKGKSLRDPVKLREDIDGITGATISSRSLTDGIRKLLNVYQDITAGTLKP